MILALIAVPLLLAQAEPDPKRMGKDHARTPFSAAEICAACPEGRVSTFRVQSGAPDAMLQTFKFGKGDETSTRFTVSMAKEDGTPMGRSHTAPMKWRALQSHASFPENQTKITEGRAKTPAGEFHCLIYTVTQAAAGVETVRTFHFAKRLPGPPVKMTQSIGGKQAMSMTLIRHRRGDEMAVLKKLRLDAKHDRDALLAEFKTVDADRNGKITAAEWTARKREMWEFRSGDVDRSGDLSADEWLKVSMARAQAAKVWTKLPKDASLRFDRNEDGKVDQEEFTRNWVEWTCDP